MRVYSFLERKEPKELLYKTNPQGIPPAGLFYVKALVFLTTKEHPLPFIGDREQERQTGKFSTPVWKRNREERRKPMWWKTGRDVENQDADVGRMVIPGGSFLVRA